MKFVYDWLITLVYRFNQQFNNAVAAKTEPPSVGIIAARKVVRLDVWLTLIKYRGR
ncbi:hypothetical protein GCM10009000_034800 [Halobacterium noricense]